VRFKRHGVQRLVQRFLFPHLPRLPLVPPARHPPEAHQPVERAEERAHQFVVALLLGVLEQVLDQWLMIAAVERLIEIVEDLPPGPRPTIDLPTVGEGREPLVPPRRPQRVEEPIVLGTEVLVGQQEWITRAHDSPTRCEVLKIRNERAVA